MPDEVEVPEVEVGVTEPIEPETFDVVEDGLYRLDADGDPIPGAELKSGWLRQSDYTRKTQELADRRAAWEKKEQEAAEHNRQYQQQLAQHYEQQARQQQMQQQQRPAQDPRAAIWEKAKANGGIITIEEAQALNTQWEQQFTQQAQQNQQLLQALGMINNRVNQLQGPISSMQSERQESQITSRLNAFLDDNSIPQGEPRTKMAAFLKEWEPTPEERMQGKDLEDAWGEMLQTFTGSTKEIELAQANAAAKNLGRAGGVAKPSNGVKPPMSVEQIVEATWKK